LSNLNLKRLKKLRDALSLDKVSFLDWMWCEFKMNEEWPSRRSVIKYFKSLEKYNQAVLGLDGNLVYETDSFQDKHFKLTVLGLLCITNGEKVENALCIVLSAIQDSYLKYDSDCDLDYKEVLSDNENLADEVYHVMRAFHNLVPKSSCHLPPNYILTVSDNAEVLTDHDSTEEYLMKKAFLHFYAGKPPLVEDRKNNDQAFCTLSIATINELVNLASVKEAMEEVRFGNVERAIKGSIYAICGLLIGIVVLQYYPQVNVFSLNMEWAMSVGRVIGIAGTIWGITVLWVVRKLPKLICKRINKKYYASLEDIIQHKHKVIDKKVKELIFRIE